MLIRYFWPNCPFRNKEWGAEPLDAFWVEASLEQAEAAIFPYLNAAAIKESHDFVERYQHVAEIIGSSSRPYCFLISRDLSAIDPFHVHYPFHQLWAAYSPFEVMPEVIIETLEELKAITLPPKQVSAG